MESERTYVLLKKKMEKNAIKAVKIAEEFVDRFNSIKNVLSVENDLDFAGFFVFL